MSNNLNRATTTVSTERILTSTLLTNKTEAQPQRLGHSKSFAFLSTFERCQLEKVSKNFELVDAIYKKLIGIREGLDHFKNFINFFIEINEKKEALQTSIEASKNCFDKIQNEETFHEFQSFIPNFYVKLSTFGFFNKSFFVDVSKRVDLVLKGVQKVEAECCDIFQMKKQSDEKQKLLDSVVANGKAFATEQIAFHTLTEELLTKLERFLFSHRTVVEQTLLKTEKLQLLFVRTMSADILRQMVYIDTEKVLTKCNNWDSYFKLNVPQARDADIALMDSLRTKAKEVCLVEEKRVLCEKCEEEQKKAAESISQQQAAGQQTENIHRQSTDVLSDLSAEGGVNVGANVAPSSELTKQKTVPVEEAKESVSVGADSDGRSKDATEAQNVAGKEKAQNVDAAKSAETTGKSSEQVPDEAKETVGQQVSAGKRADAKEHTAAGESRQTVVSEEQAQAGKDSEKQSVDQGADSAEHKEKAGLDKASADTERVLAEEAALGDENESSKDEKSDEKEAEPDVSLVDDPSRQEKEEIVGQIAKSVVEIVQEKEEEELAKEIENEIDVLNKNASLVGKGAQGLQSEGKQSSSSSKASEQEGENAALNGAKTSDVKSASTGVSEAGLSKDGKAIPNDASNGTSVQSQQHLHQQHRQNRPGAQIASNQRTRESPHKSRSMTSLCAPTMDQKELRQQQDLQRQNGQSQPNQLHLSHHSFVFTEKKRAIAERFLQLERQYIVSLSTAMEAAAELVESSDVFRYLTAGEANEIFANLSDLCVFHTRFYEYVEKLGPSETLLRVTLKEVFRKLLFEAYSYYLSHFENGCCVLQQKMAQSRELSTRIKKFTERKKCEDLCTLLNKPLVRIEELREYYRDLQREFGGDPRAKDAADALKVIDDLDVIRKRASESLKAMKFINKYSLTLPDLPRYVIGDHQMTMMVQHNRSVKLRDVHVILFSDAVAVFKGRDGPCIDLFHLDKAELKVEDGDTDYPIFSLKEGEAEVKLFSHSKGVGVWIQTKIEECISIKKGQQLFGVDLDELSHQPQTVLELDYIFNVAKKLSVNCEGVFRLSVASSKLQKVVEKMNYGIFPHFTEHDGSLCACLIKYFFRSLKTPLLDGECAEMLCASSKKLGTEETTTIVQEVKEALFKLSTLAYKIAYMFFDLLGTIDLAKEKTKMTANNLSIIFASQIIKSPHEQNITIDQLNAAAKPIQDMFVFMIEHTSDIFTEKISTEIDESTLRVRGEIASDRFLAVSKADLSLFSKREEEEAKKKKKFGFSLKGIIREGLMLKAKGKKEEWRNCWCCLVGTECHVFKGKLASKPTETINLIGATIAHCTSKVKQNCFSITLPETAHHKAVVHIFSCHSPEDAAMWKHDLNAVAGGESPEPKNVAKWTGGALFENDEGHNESTESNAITESVGIDNSQKEEAHRGKLSTSQENVGFNSVRERKSDRRNHLKLSEKQIRPSLRDLSQPHKSEAHGTSTAETFASISESPSYEQSHSSSGEKKPSEKESSKKSSKKQ